VGCPTPTATCTSATPTYVVGDAYSRARTRRPADRLRLAGRTCIGTPIVVNAAKEGVDPEEHAPDYHETYEENLPKFNVASDNAGHTHDETNTELTQSFVESWIDGDHVYEQEIQVGYDPEADQRPRPLRRWTCPLQLKHARGDE